jgi:hypothetical protein
MLEARKVGVAKRGWVMPKLILLTRGEENEAILGCCKTASTIPGGPIVEWGRCGSYGPRKCGAWDSGHTPGGTDWNCGDATPTCNDACCGTQQKCGVGGCTGCGNSCKGSTNS